MEFEEVRRFALSLPETTEEPHFDRTSFRVTGRIFATAPPEGEFLHVFLDEHATRAAVAEHPEIAEELWWGRRLAGVRLRLAAAKPEWLCELLTEAWRRRAPKRVAALLSTPASQGGASC